jgi:hypothetical protein
MPSMMQDHLSRFEDRIQQIVEGGFARLFAGRLHPKEVATRLARAMEDRAYLDAEGRMTAPDIYIIRLNPADHEAVLEAEPMIARSLAEDLVELAQTGEFGLSGFPEVRLLADSDVAPYHVEISAQLRGQHLETTEGYPLEEVPLPAPKAAILLNGDQHIPLDRPITNLGRQRDNHIILDDVRVSRHHAQMRVRFGKYVIFDLGSSGGTTINGSPIKEAVLQSGDVVGLAGATFIFVEEGDPSEDSAAGDGVRGTEPYSPSGL